MGRGAEVGISCVGCTEGTLTCAVGEVVGLADEQETTNNKATIKGRRNFLTGGIKTPLNRKIYTDSCKDKDALN